MNLRQRRSREEPEINLVSLVDVVLLLLIFFMLTTSFVRQSELAVRLPQAAAGSASDPEQSRSSKSPSVNAACFWSTDAH